ncbi:amino acid transporter AVT6C-like [Macadamia integrifolia]|uniref:amino acid transporter AVT6C-like n=1 Tax=Macadamia integrifolia TaxID=60698 RepID=UPI001C4EEAA0|nr:amino acid transporter AVT6C-like [Macadamia integrifolia]
MRDPRMKKPATKEADIHTSLLPELRPPLERKSTDTDDGGASVPGAVFNVSTSIIGAGIMSIPATLKVLGIIPAFILIVIIAVLSDVSVNFLLRFTNIGNSRTYAGVMGEAFGRIGSLALQICVMLTNMGSLIIYLIIIGDVLSGSQSEESIYLGVLQEWFGFHWWNTRAFALLFTVLFVMLPLVLLRRVESLRFTSAVSVLLAVVFVAISTVMAIVALWEGKTQSPRLFPDLAHQASFFELFTAVPVIVTAFTFHFNVHPIAAELQNPSKMVSAVRISLILCSTIYLTVGFFGYLLFGDSIMPDILVNFDRNSDSPMGSVLDDTVRLSYALHLMLVFPLLNFSLRANIHELFTKSPPSASDTTKFVSLTCSLLGLIYIAAIALPNIWYFFQFMGSTSAVRLTLIFPGAIALRDVHGISTRRDRILAALMIILAVITSCVAITSNVTSLTR